MPKFEVALREVHVRYLEVEADNPEEAIKIAMDDPTLPDEILVEYSHLMSRANHTAIPIGE